MKKTNSALKIKQELTYKCIFVHRFHYASNREDRNIFILDSKFDLKSPNLVRKKWT